MFSTPAERAVYEYALTRHDELMADQTNDGASYRNGYAGRDERFGDNHEHWRAGKTQSLRHAAAGTYPGRHWSDPSAALPTTEGEGE